MRQTTMVFGEALRHAFMSMSPSKVNILQLFLAYQVIILTASFQHRHPKLSSHFVIIQCCHPRNIYVSSFVYPVIPISDTSHSLNFITWKQGWTHVDGTRSRAPDKLYTICVHLNYELLRYLSGLHKHLYFASMKGSIPRKRSFSNNILFHAKLYSAYPIEKRHFLILCFLFTISVFFCFFLSKTSSYLYLLCLEQLSTTDVAVHLV